MRNSGRPLLTYWARASLVSTGLPRYSPALPRNCGQRGGGPHGVEPLRAKGRAGRKGAGAQGLPAGACAREPCLLACSYIPPNRGVSGSQSRVAGDRNIYRPLRAPLETIFSTRGPLPRTRARSQGGLACVQTAERAPPRHDLPYPAARRLPVPPALSAVLPTGGLPEHHLTSENEIDPS